MKINPISPAKIINKESVDMLESLESHVNESSKDD